MTEALNQTAEEVSEARLVETLQQHVTEQPDALLESVLDSVRRFCGHAPQRDDVTAVVMQFR